MKKKKKPPLMSARGAGSGRTASLFVTREYQRDDARAGVASRVGNVLSCLSPENAAKRGSEEPRGTNLVVT
jgi:hypothetical protein